MRHQIRFQLWYDGDWHDVPTYQRSEITITDGQQDKLSQPSPAHLSGVQINNRDGRYSPDNAMSPLYGKIGRATRCRLIVDGAVEFVGEIEGLPVEWTTGGIDVWVPVTAHSIAHRLGMAGSKRRVRSAVRRFCDAAIADRMGRLAPRAYWPIDHGEASATNQAAPVVGAMPLTLDYAVGGGTATWAAADLAPWLGRGLQIDGSMSISGLVPEDATVTEAVAADVVVRNALPGDLPAAIALFLYGAATGGGETYDYFLIATVSAPGGTSLFLYRQAESDFSIFPFGMAAAAAAAKIWDNRVHHLRVMATQNGSDVDVSAYVDGDLVISGTHPSVTLGSPYWRLMMNDRMQSVVGHAILWAGDAADIPPADDVSAAVQGHAGEPAHERVQRVFTEDGIPITVIGSESQLVGSQPVDTGYEVARDAAAVDMGVLWEDQADYGFIYRCHADLYNQAPALTLTWGSNEIGGKLQPRPDLDYVQNAVTVRRRWGSETTLVQETGPLNVQDPTNDPQGVGPVEVSYELGLYDDGQTYHHAGWIRWVGTQPGARYPVVVIDCDRLAVDAKTGLIAAATALRLGDRIQIASPPQWAQTSTIDLMVVGRTRRISGTRRVIELNCVPYSAWDVGVLGDFPADPDAPGGRLAGHRDTALTADVDATDTTLTVDPQGEAWALLWVRDDGDRTVPSGWGDPDVGPPWDDSPSGGTASVAGGDLIHTVTVADDYVSCVADGLSVEDVQVQVLGAVPESTPSGAEVRQVCYLRTDFAGTNVTAGVVWHTDGTASAFGDSSAQSAVSATIPGITASEPVDLLVALRGTLLAVWAAPSSAGIDLSSPLVVMRVTVTGAGGVSVDTESGAGMSVPLAVHYGAIYVTAPGSLVTDFPFLVKLLPAPGVSGGGEVVRVVRATDSGGSLVLDVERGANGITKPHEAGTRLAVVDPLVLTL